MHLLYRMEKNIETQFPKTSPFPRTPGVFQGAPDAPASAPIVTPSLRTMKNDMAEAIKRQNETYVSIALAEERKKRIEQGAAIVARGGQVQGETSIPKRRGRIFVVVGFIFLTAALGFSLRFLLPIIRTIQMPEVSLPNFGGYSELATTTTPVAAPLVSFAPALLPVQSERRFNVSQETTELIVATIAVERVAGVPVGSIKNLFFAEDGAGKSVGTEPASIPAPRLLAAFGAQMPDILIRSLERDFMAGLLGEAGAAMPFLILKVSSYEGGLAGMLSWEKELPHFFSTFFSIKSDTRLSGDRSAFRDIVVLGRDARVLDIAPGQSIAYAFTDANTIIIAGSQSALGDLMLKVTGKAAR